MNKEVTKRKDKKECLLSRQHFKPFGSCAITKREKKDSSRVLLSFRSLFSADRAEERQRTIIIE
jgi:hypothetical protein